MSPRALPTGMRALLDRPIAFHRALVPVSGGALPALMLSQAIFWQLRTSSGNGWWWKTREEWAEETGLTRSEQETVRRLLRSRPWWFEDLRGVPARLHYMVDLDLLLVQLAGFQPTGRQKSDQPDGDNTASRLAQEPPTNTKTTKDHAKTTTSTGGELVWPVQLATRAREACERELRGCPPDRHADIVRELSHRLIRAPHDPLRLPHLWVRALARAASAGTLVKIAPAALLDAEQRDAIEREYQRRLQASRERGAIALSRLTPQR